MSTYIPPGDKVILGQAIGWKAAYFHSLSSILDYNSLQRCRASLKFFVEKQKQWKKILIISSTIVRLVPKYLQQKSAITILHFFSSNL